MIILGLLIILCLTIFLGYRRQGAIHQMKLQDARNVAKKIITSKNLKTKTEIKKFKQDSLSETKQYQASIEQELAEDQKDNERKQNWINQRVTVLNQKKEILSNRNDALNDKRDKVKKQKMLVVDTNNQAHTLIRSRWQKLQEVAQLKETAAKKEIIRATKTDVATSKAEYLKNSQTEIANDADTQANDLIDLAMEHVNINHQQSENQRSLIVDDSEYLGKIIGNNGQNVRTLEALTGVDIIIDDLTKELTINGYDPVHRVIAFKAIELIKNESHVIPDTIEKIVNKSNKIIDQKIRQLGEETVKELKLDNVDPDLIKFIGRMNYRTSYGQNILEHSIETAKIAGILAVELGENPTLARRAGLLHDIGKSIDRDIEATHVELGVELAQKFHENPVVINTIASHHGDVEAKTVIADLVEAADAISGARQGARSESVADYLQRIKSLEKIAKNHQEVNESYAIQAGRELRVIVKPNQTTDDGIIRLASDVKDQIEDEVTYPGQVKVTVIRKLEVSEVADQKQKAQ